MCGEKASLVLSVLSLQGSPPHVRGKVQSAASPVPKSGITPACAGKRIFEEGQLSYD